MADLWNCYKVSLDNQLLAFTWFNHRVSPNPKMLKPGGFHAGPHKSMSIPSLFVGYLWVKNKVFFFWFFHLPFRDNNLSKKLLQAILQPQGSFHQTNAQGRTIAAAS